MIEKIKTYKNRYDNIVEFRNKYSIAEDVINDALGAWGIKGDCIKNAKVFWLKNEQNSERDIEKLFEELTKESSDKKTSLNDLTKKIIGLLGETVDENKDLTEGECLDKIGEYLSKMENIQKEIDKIQKNTKSVEGGSKNGAVKSKNDSTNIDVSDLVKEYNKFVDNVKNHPDIVRSVFSGYGSYSSIATSIKKDQGEWKVSHGENNRHTFEECKCGDNSTLKDLKDKLKLFLGSEIVNKNKQGITDTINELNNIMRDKVINNPSIKKMYYDCIENFNKCVNSWNKVINNNKLDQNTKIKKLRTLGVLNAQKLGVENQFKEFNNDSKEESLEINVKNLVNNINTYLKGNRVIDTENLDVENMLRLALQETGTWLKNLGGIIVHREDPIKKSEIHDDKYNEYKEKLKEAQKLYKNNKDKYGDELDVYLTNLERGLFEWAPGLFVENEPLDSSRNYMYRHGSKKVYPLKIDTPKDLENSMKNLNRLVDVINNYEKFQSNKESAVVKDYKDKFGKFWQEFEEAVEKHDNFLYSLYDKNKSKEDILNISKTVLDISDKDLEASELLKTFLTTPSEDRVSEEEGVIHLVKKTQDRWKEINTLLDIGSFVFHVSSLLMSVYVMVGDLNTSMRLKALSIDYSSKKLNKKWANTEKILVQLDELFKLALEKLEANQRKLDTVLSEGVDNVQNVFFSVCINNFNELMDLADKFLNDKNDETIKGSLLAERGILYKKEVDLKKFESDSNKKLRENVNDFIERINTLCNRYMKEIDSAGNDETIMQRLKEANEIINKCKEKFDKKAVNKLEKAVEELEKVKEEEVMGEVKGKFKELTEKYDKLVKKYKSFFDGENSEAVSSMKIKYDNISKATLNDFLSSVKEYIDTVLAPLGDKTKKKYQDKCDQIQGNFNKAKDDKTKSDCLTQMYELAARAVYRLEKNIAKQEKRKREEDKEKEELKDKSKLDKAIYKAKKVGRKAGKKLDKLLGTDHVFHSKKNKDGGDKSAKQAKLVKKCFKNAANYIVKFKLGSFKRKELSKAFNGLPKEFSGWKEALQRYFGSDNLISNFALEEDKKKDYKKASVAVLLASLCGLPNTECIISACEGLKEGGLRGNFKGRDYLNDAVKIRKDVKTKAIAGGKESVKSYLLSYNAIVKLESLIKDYAQFKNVVGAFSNIKYDESDEQGGNEAGGGSAPSTVAGGESTPAEKKKGVTGKISNGLSKVRTAASSAGKAIGKAASAAAGKVKGLFTKSPKDTKDDAIEER